MSAPVYGEAVHSDAAHAGWLLVATLLHQMAARHGPDRRRSRAQLAGNTARAWAASGFVLPPDLVRCLAALDASEAGAAGGMSGDASGAASEAVVAAITAVRRFVDGMEVEGAFHLAYATLADAERALAEDAPGPRGWARVQRARVARQLGDLDAAHALYEAAARLGDEARDAELQGRAWVGRAVVANMRGNYPAARAACEAALRVAGHLPAVGAVAHHALFVGAAARRDVDAALQHGWRAFEGAAGDANGRADALLNLSSVARTAGFPDAALRGFRAVLRLTPLARLRLPALRGAALAAATAANRAEFDRFAAAIDAEGPASGQPYELGMSLVALAEGAAALGDVPRARAYARRATALASEHGFREVEYRADVVASTSPPPPRPPSGKAPARPATHTPSAVQTPLSASSRSVVDRLLGFEEATALTTLVG